MNNDPSTLDVLKALGNKNRLQILKWILSPTEYFPPQRDGDLIEDGVCVGFITQKIDLTQPTVTAHMKVLADAKLVTSKQIKNWVFYKADRERIKGALARMGTELKL
ncbi:ArsR/SmtB family transcription factor [Leisingera methylohalidivorans]|uniref:ArsR family transcriptional regulator n=1 Tax=Leisingera methylohalidivorans DSM 14336 TaxID=999552 RepID=V9W390_9RHOB|nr:metalloregulator ArsR/SmtB family transcription factor [Leisingera methylohalidivorans]AHD03627.1 ArsR family transcriptional regulator [Leisingera methylohalidivorans DSM 14336]